MKRILDTNVLLRFLVGDNKVQQKQAEKWFAQAEKGELKIVVKPLVIAETCFVLESFYKNSRIKIAEAMEVFLSQKWLKVTDRKVLLDLWSNYRQGLHFVDSYLLSWARHEDGEVLSFDKKVKRHRTSSEED